MNSSMHLLTQIIENNPKFDNLKEVAKSIAKRLRKDADITIGITGYPGTGKTNLAIWLAAAISFYAERDFSLKENIAYLAKEIEVINQFNRLPQYSVFLVDEAAKGFHKHQWHTSTQQALVETYNTERWQNKATLLLMPRFKDFNEFFRNGRILIWIDVLERGTAVVYLKDTDSHVGFEDPWHIKENIKIKANHYKHQNLVSDMETRMTAAEKCKGFWRFIYWEQLPVEVEEEYKKHRAESREEEKKLMLEQAEKQSEEPETKAGKRTRGMLLKAINKFRDQGLTFKEIGEVLGCTPTAVRVAIEKKVETSQPITNINQYTQKSNTSTIQRDHLNILHNVQDDEIKVKDSSGEQNGS